MSDTAATPCLIGVDWFPEHWPEERWGHDLELMREAGMTVVRIAEFTWSKTQPRPEVWEWDWLDRAVQAIEDAGLKSILCTPSACPPPWLTAEDPTILPDVDFFGFTGIMKPGHRRHYSPHHVAYREASADCARRMAERYADRPSVIGYQVDNELVGACNDVGPLAAAAFQAWMAKRHGTVAAMDERLGLVFWGQQVDDWSQLPVPRDGKYHPGLQLEFQRFASAAWVAFCRAQADAMRPLLRDDQVLTTNCYLPYWGMVMDWAELMRDGGLDLFAFDNYAREPEDGAFFNDLARSLSPEYWILEQQCGSTAAQNIWPDRVGRIKEDGDIAVRKGAKVITYFRWRQGCFGNEQDHGAILDHHGEPGPIYDEVRDFISERPTVPTPTPSIGVAFTWDDARAAASANPPVAYEPWQREALGKALFATGRDARYCFAPEHLAEVDTILLPFRFIHDAAWEQAVHDALAAGKTVVAFPLLFAKDVWGAYNTTYLSEAMRAAFGIDVSRRIPIRDAWNGEPVAVTIDLGGTNATASTYVEELTVDDAKVLATFPAEPIAGAPLLTMKEHASGGRACWCAAYPDADGCAALLRAIGAP